MLYGIFRSLFDASPATTLAQLEVACLEHEDAKACIRLWNFKANIALDVLQSVVERHRLAPSNEFPEAVTNDIVRESLTSVKP